MAGREHLVRGNVDLKLALIMAGGTIIGTEAGAQAIQYLKQLKMVNLIVGICFIVVLVLISAFMAWESWATIKGKGNRIERRKGKDDESAVGGFSAKVQRIKLWPMLKLAESEIKSISLWNIVMVALIGGLFAGFLGGGVGYVRLPLLAYVLGVPTKVAVGTDLFEVIFSASYGTISHAIKGKRGYNDRAHDADRRSRGSADWRRLDGILSWPTDSIGVLAVPTDRGGPGCLRLDDGTPDEVMTTHQGVTCHL